MNTLKRRLQSRHLTMIALGGSIGTGLFLTSGMSIHSAGPGGAVLGYGLIAIMVYFLMTSLAEMSTYAPTTGTFCEYSGQYVDPAFGFAMGWNYWFSLSISIAVDILSAAFIMTFWFPDANTLQWSGLFYVVIFGINLFTVKLFGETEYFLSMVKVSFIIIFIIVGGLTIVGMLGHNAAVNFSNWTIGDAPFHGGGYAVVGVLLLAGFSFQGTELVGVAAGEAKTPQKSVPKAIKMTFWRILIFYLLSLVVISFLIPYTSPSLASSHVTMSPFTLIFQQAGLQFAASLTNAIILVAVLSTGNANMYSATRIMWYLAKSHQGPKSIAKVSRSGVPYMALIITAIAGSAFLLTYKFQNGVIFHWLVNISSLAGFVVWFGIALSHYRFRRAYLAQGFDMAALPYRSKLFPLAPVIAMVLIAAIIIGQPLNAIVSHEFTWGTFFSTYMGVIVFFIIGIGYKIKHHTRLIPLDKCVFHHKQGDPSP
ncbi:amino acid permease [Shewanella surugensis]|uniref:Amino acid permease n=1 Tax=Shewanella surugensis TaxID=212020 RepID=A0ABT0LJ67_9GAMM|nr:amino acid permease [Shewanella surugensis]MCL1127753.1 amino acid permease [Shewanella surugensis]